jgi:polyisoprenoid-binding protein YceI
VTIGGREGGFSTFGGTVEMEGDNFESINVNATIDMTSVFSDATELTKKLKGEENFFNPVKWPASTFKSTSVKKAGDHYDVTGDLSLRDKTKSITFPASISLEGSSLKVTAELQLNRQDFDITYQSTIGDYVIKDMATVKLDITAEPASGAASGSALAPAA